MQGWTNGYYISLNHVLQIKCHKMIFMVTTCRELINAEYRHTTVDHSLQEVTTVYIHEAICNTTHNHIIIVLIFAAWLWLLCKLLSLIVLWTYQIGRFRIVRINKIHYWRVWWEVYVHIIHTINTHCNVNMWELKRGKNRLPRFKYIVLT